MDDYIKILGGLIVVLLLGIGLGRAFYGIPGATQRFESKGITVHYGRPDKTLYTYKLHTKSMDDFFFFAQKYNVTEVWILRGTPSWFYFIDDDVRYYW